MAAGMTCFRARIRVEYLNHHPYGASPSAKRVDRHIRCPSRHPQRGVRARLGPMADRLVPGVGHGLPRLRHPSSPASTASNQ
jgi:hypothetical protein